MNSKRWQKINSLFHSVLKIEPAQRAAFLDQASGGDEALREEVESLIAAHDEAGGFIEGPAFAAAAEMLGAGEAPSLVGRSFGAYRIVSALGSGGMGEVYLAQDTRLGRKVALKLLPAYFTRDENRVHRFQQEARAASALNHPNILTIYHIDTHDGAPYIVSELLEGETLQQRIGTHASGVPLSQRKAIDYASQIARGMAAAHEKGIVHRDLKPDNIFITRDGRVKILDFGIAKLIQPERTHSQTEIPTRRVDTSPGVVMGTVGYMSPEQVRGQKVDHRSDIFSFGAILYEMLSGRRAFHGESAADTLNAILNEDPPDLSNTNQNVSPALERLVNRCIEKNPESRFHSASDLAFALEAISGSPAASAAETAQASKPADTSWMARHKFALSFAALMITVAIVGLGLYLYARNAEVAIDSIAVLPFENHSSDADTDYLSDGLAESLIYSLSQLPNLKVSPTSTVFRYKGKEIDPIKIGKDLGVSAVLSGRITQRGDNLTVSAELVDVRNNKLLWGEHYDRKASELLATQRDMAHEIVDNLKLKVSPQESGLPKHYTESNEAYQLYLKGRFHWNKRTREGLKKAIDYFNQAIEHDPGFALAYAGLADCYVVPANALAPREAMPKAKAAAMRALQLDDTLAEAHTSLGRVLAVYDWNWAEAEHEFKRAIELNPRYAVAHQWYAGYLQSMHRLDDGIAEGRRALELDPLSPILTFEVGLEFYYARDYDKAIEYYQKTLELDPNFPPAYGQLPAAYEQKGMYDQAIAGFQKGVALEASGEFGFSLSGLGHTYAVSGRTNEARAVLDGLKRMSEQEYVRPDRIALIYAGLGEKDQAFAWLEKAYEARAFNMVWLSVDPRWDSLRSDPRFAEIVKRVGIPR